MISNKCFTLKTSEHRIWLGNFKRAGVTVKMPLRRNRPFTEAYEQEFKQRVMERMKERLDQFVDQLADLMNDMMDPRRRTDRNSRESEGEESENPFFDGDG
nr:reverse transcriptase domain-containing protein [Tanacetum cinerariifolium]